MSEKITAQTNISLLEKGKLLSNEEKIAETIFKNTFYQLGINTGKLNLVMKAFVFEKIGFKVKILKMFKISSEKYANLWNGGLY